MIVLNHKKSILDNRFDKDYLKHKISYCIGLLSVSDESEYTSKLFSNVLTMLMDCTNEIKELEKEENYE